MQQQDVKCDYFKWCNPEICVYDQRVLSRLREWHESLKAKRELTRTNISNEVEKCKNEAKKCKNEAEKYKSKLGRQKKFRLVERKYQFTLIC
jgi:hypothetical protein